MAGARAVHAHTAGLVVSFGFSKGVVVFLDVYRNVKLLLSPIPKVLSFALGVSLFVSGVPKQQKASSRPL